MKKVRPSTYKKDKYYPKVTRAVHEILKQKPFVSPIDVLVKIDSLSEKDVEDWRFGRIPYLERVIRCNLSKAMRILRVLRYHAADRGLRPSHTGYKKRGKGVKIKLHFSKSGNPRVEELYSTHYVAGWAEKNAKAKVDKKERQSPNASAEDTAQDKPVVTEVKRDHR